MKIAVIYASKYGSTETYARWIAEELDAGLYLVKAVSAEMLQDYDAVIYGGGLYAGGVDGLPAMVKQLSNMQNKPFILFTCGIADPQDPENMEHIRRELRKVLPPDLEARTTFFHLRGRLNYKQLNLVHRAMMAMLKRMILKKDPASLRAEDQQILETYGKDVNFIDRASIEPIVAYVRAL